MEGGGEATKWWVPLVLKLNTAKCCKLRLFSAPHIVAKSMINVTSQSCDDLQLAVCLSKLDGAIERSPEHSCMSNKVQKSATGKNSGTFSNNTYLNCQLMGKAIM